MGMMSKVEDAQPAMPKKGRFEVEVLDKGFSMTAWREKEAKGDIYPMTDMKKGVAASAEEVQACFAKFMKGEDPFKS